MPATLRSGPAVIISLECNGCRYLSGGRLGWWCKHGIGGSEAGWHYIGMGNDTCPTPPECPRRSRKVTRVIPKR